MRTMSIAILLALLVCETTALAGGRTGQAKSAEVLAKRTAASPRGAKQWGGKSAAYLHKTQKESRATLRRTPWTSYTLWTALAKNEAAASLRDIVGKHLGLTPGQLASKDRRHDRAILKELRRMVREVRIAGTAPRIEGKLTAEIAKIKQRQVDSRRTTH